MQSRHQHYVIWVISCIFRLAASSRAHRACGSQTTKNENPL